jgi:hypothetical protein
MSRAALVTAVLATAFAFAACSGEKAGSGLGEPIRVRNGVFKEGPLPGAPPAATPGPGASVTAIETAGTVLRPGQGEKTLSGRASVGSVAVAIGLAGFGTGYWLLPVEGPDPLNGGELGWQALLEVGRDVVPGAKELRVVAVDAAGNAGTQRALPICVPRLLPDNLNACDPSIPPPAAVVSLTWDTPVDLDLIAVAPDGRVIDAKHPRGGAPAAAADAGPPAPAAPSIDRDSNPSCALDRVQQEDLVFPDTPAPGSYLVFVNMFAACERAPAHFRVTVSSRQATPDGKLTLVDTESKTGVLTNVNANGGASLGTYVTEVAF